MVHAFIKLTGCSLAAGSEQSWCRGMCSSSLAPAWLHAVAAKEGTPPLGATGEQEGQGGQVGRGVQVVQGGQAGQGVLEG